MKNMKQLVEKMKPGAVMLIVERAKYKSVQNFRDKLFIELRAKGNVDIEKDIAGFNGVEINPSLTLFLQNWRPISLWRFDKRCKLRKIYLDGYIQKVKSPSHG